MLVLIFFLKESLFSIACQSNWKKTQSFLEKRTLYVQSEPLSPQDNDSINSSNYLSCEDLSDNEKETHSLEDSLTTISSTDDNSDFQDKFKQDSFQQFLSSIDNHKIKQLHEILEESGHFLLNYHDNIFITLLEAKPQSAHIFIPEICKHKEKISLFNKKTKEAFIYSMKESKNNRTSLFLLQQGLILSEIYHLIKINKKQCRLFLQEHINTFKPSTDTLFSLLSIASYHGWEETARLILKQEKPQEIFNLKTNCPSPLIIAITMKQTQVAKILLEKMPSIQVYNQDKNNPLFIALITDQISLTDHIKETMIRTQESLQNDTNKHEQNILHIACSKGEEDLIDEFQTFEKINQQDQRNNTPLMEAARNNHTNCIHKMKTLNASVNLQNLHGETALMLLISNNGSIRSYQKLTSEKHGIPIDFNIEDNNGNTALSLAIKHQQPNSIIQDLIQKTHFRSSQAIKQVILSSIHVGNNDIFIQYWNQLDNENRTIIYAQCFKKAIQHERNKILIILTKQPEWNEQHYIEALKTVNDYFSKKCTMTLLTHIPPIPNGIPLSLISHLFETASNQKSKKTMDLILQTFPQLLEKEEFNPLFYIFEHDELVDKIITQRPDLFLRKVQSITPLMFFAHPEHHISESLFQKVLTATQEAGQLEEKSQIGNTALSIACKFNNIRILKMLLQEKADINTVNDEGETPLIIATKNSFLPIVTILVKNQANLQHQDNDGSTALMHAICQDDPEEAEITVGFLLDHGADINVQNDNGDTALFVAILNGNDNIINLLLKYKPQLNIENQENHTPFTLSLQTDFDYAWQLLKYAQKENQIDQLLKFRFQNEELIWAIMKSAPLTLIQTLLHYSPNVNTPNCLGHTPLLTSCDSEDSIIFNTLLQRGADIHIKNPLKKTYTPLILATKNQNITIVKTLLHMTQPIKDEQKEEIDLALKIAQKSDCVPLINLLKKRQNLIKQALLAKEQQQQILLKYPPLKQSFSSTKKQSHSLKRTTSKTSITYNSKTSLMRIPPSLYLSTNNLEIYS